REHDGSRVEVREQVADERIESATVFDDEVGARECKLVAGGGLVAVRILRRAGDDAGDGGAVARDTRGNVAVYVRGRDDREGVVVGRGFGGGAARKGKPRKGDEGDGTAREADAARTGVVGSLHDEGYLSNSEFSARSGR